MTEDRDIGGPGQSSCDDLIQESKHAVATRLRHIRQHHPEGPFTLAVLAERSGVSQRTLAQLESAEGANVTLETLVKLSHSLGIPRPGYFIDDVVFRQVNAELATLAEMRKHKVQGVALRTSAPTDLPPASVEELTQLLSGILSDAAKARDALQELPSAQPPTPPHESGS
ncbi:helix-turn-helix domain-containing protein [Streptomyces sp. NPDC059037]|uniref:helix-turn-helix domain-containing protein n=1 Tax=Streptomyces sp. NPDC059037 TaxID=3346710 RepID=UPI0036C983A7